MAHTTRTGNFSVSSVEFGVNSGTNIVDTQSTALLTLIPDPGFTLDAADFSYTSGPSQVESVTFAQSGANVIATVTFAAGAVMPSNDLDIPICISGDSGLVEYTLSGIIEVISSANVVPVTSNIPYTASGNEGDDSQVFSQTITAAEGYYFPTAPTGYLTSGNPNSYLFSESIVTNNDGEITAKTFTGDYTFGSSSVSGDVFTIVAEAALIPVVVREITSYSITTSNIDPSGETRAMTIFGTDGAQFSLTVVNEDETSILTSPLTNITIPATGAYSFNITFPAVTDTDDYDFVLTGDLASTFDTVEGQPSTFTLNQYIDITLGFGLTSTNTNITVPSNYNIIYPAKTVLASTDLNYNFTAILTATSTVPISETTPPLISDLTNLDESLNGGTDVTISSVTSSMAADNLSYTITISGNTNETGELDVLSTLNLDNYISSNTAPVANDGSFSVSKGLSQAVTLVGTDADNDSLDYIIVSLPTNGTLYTDVGLTDPITSGELPYTLVANTVYYEHDDSSNLTDSFNFKVNDGAVDSSAASITISVGVAVGSSISTIGSAGVYYVPITVGTEAGTFKVHFQAYGLPDRLQVLFDTNGVSNELSDMEVVADSLWVGDNLYELPQDNDAANGTYTNVGEYTYVGSGGNAPSSDFTTADDPTAAADQWDKTSSSATITISDDVVCNITSLRSGAATAISNGQSRGPATPGGSDYGYQIGAQNGVYEDESTTTLTTGLLHVNGNICLTYTKPATTSAFTAYLKIEGIGNTGWDVFQTEFEEDLP